MDLYKYALVFYSMTTSLFVTALLRKLGFQIVFLLVFFCCFKGTYCFDEICRLQGLLPTQQSEGDVATSLVLEVSHPNSATEVGVADISLGPQSELLAGDLVSVF
ncbi:uncharacterized protein LOC130767687 [Actinidia eriantha]|uniref:uncharacterized protein LOC130767687 n=1 Tax=Actinidia eriantha TaxID=165200 RepID=UPI00258AE179|nr:uncharacterized protein LOC130767687 [Actinidia eriantha]